MGEGGGGWRCQFSFSFFPVQQTTSGIGQCKVDFFGLATNALNVRNNNCTVQFGIDTIR